MEGRRNARYRRIDFDLSANLIDCYYLLGSTYHVVCDAMYSQILQDPGAVKFMSRLKHEVGKVIRVERRYV